MKVNIGFENINQDGEVTYSDVAAIMEEKNGEYRFTYMEDLSGEGNMTRSNLVASKRGMRIMRQGEISTDFIYELKLVHNTTYNTPYGKFPVSIETKEYEFTEGEDDILNAGAKYYLTMNETEPVKMGIKIKVTKA